MTTAYIRATALKRLWAAARASPNTVIYSLGRRIICDFGNWFAPYAEWPHDHSSVPSMFALPLGSYGVLYPRGCLNPWIEASDSMKELAPLQDDLWFKAASLVNHVPARASGGEGIAYPDLHIPNNASLWDQNRFGQNDAAFVCAFSGISG